MRICAACRQPLDRNERYHDCPAEPPEVTEAAEAAERQIEAEREQA